MGEKTGSERKGGALFVTAAVLFGGMLAFSGTMLVRELAQAKAEADTFAELSSLRLAPRETDPAPVIVRPRAAAEIAADEGEAPNAEPAAPETDGAADEPKAAAEAPAPMARYLPLYERNPEFFGWITIPDTNIDYPVMYSPARRNYYLTHDFYGGKAATGVPYLDEDCDPEGSFYLVYGHHPNLGTMFSQLIRYEDRAFWETHREIRFDTLYEERTYAVAIAMRARVLDQNEQHGFRYYNYTSLDTEEEFGAYIRQAGEKSLYDTGIDLSYGDELLVLSTCYHYTRNGRFVVVAKRIG